MLLNEIYISLVRNALDGSTDKVPPNIMQRGRIIANRRDKYLAVQQ